MDILIIGSGGREHAIAHTLKKSPNVENIFCAPGNGGISEIAECVPIKVMEFDKIIEFLTENPSIGLTVVAPDNPLSEGLVDILQEKGFRTFGPSKAAAFIEGSKAFSKNLMKKYGIPTANYEVFSEYYEAVDYIKKQEYPIVIKADGLAFGKGVVICNNLREAENAIYDIMVTERFGKAGKKIVIEEFVEGKEVSILAFCDGKTIKPMVSSQDHKRAFDGDKGLNTGGMGAFSPSIVYTEQLASEAYRNIILPTMHAMNSEGREFRGVIYFGLMLTENGISVLEYNARFGDPETQVVLPLLETDFLEIMQAIIDQKLADLEIKWQDKSAVCVVLTSGGYPLEFAKGNKINIGSIDDDIMLFHSGTRKGESGDLRTSGGRVIGVTAVSENLEEARKIVYKNIAKISFEGMHYRKDIGVKND